MREQEHRMPNRCDEVYYFIADTDADGGRNMWLKKIREK